LSGHPTSKQQWSMQVLILVVSIALFIGADGAKAAVSVTLEIHPDSPVVGTPAEVVVRSWSTGLDGQPDFQRPLESPYPWSVKALPASIFDRERVVPADSIAIDVSKSTDNSWTGRVGSTSSELLSTPVPTGIHSRHSLAESGCPIVRSESLRVGWPSRQLAVSPAPSPGINCCNHRGRGLGHQDEIV
jgi:hypothetical protein